MYKFSPKSKARMEGVHKDLIKIMEESIKVTPIDFGIPRYGGIRTVAEQMSLYSAKKSKADGVRNTSNHQTGRAIDIYVYHGGKASYAKRHLSLVAGVILATASRLLQEGEITHALRWGGTFGSTSFNGWDMPHFELVTP